MSGQTDLAAALARLEEALEAFRAAYGQWLEDGKQDGDLRALLHAAEARLDEARQALERVQQALR